MSRITRSQFKSSRSESGASEEDESLEEDDTFDFLKSKKGAKNAPLKKGTTAKTNAPPSLNTSIEGALKGNQNLLNISAGSLNRGPGVILEQRQAQKRLED